MTAAAQSSPLVTYLSIPHSSLTCAASTSASPASRIASSAEMVMLGLLRGLCGREATRRFRPSYRCQRADLGHRFALPR